MNTESSPKKSFKETFGAYAWLRIGAAVVIIVLIVWGAAALLSMFGGPDEGDLTASEDSHGASVAASSGHGGAGEAASPLALEEGEAAPAAAPGPTLEGAAYPEDEEVRPRLRIKGMAFVKAAIKPIEYELNQRLGGWRPNDLVQPTDNVNNFQLGVLEVTRRTAVMLAERLSRTGTTDIMDENLERAMNWFMVAADSYWFPSAEKKYREGIRELEAYSKKLAGGEARFFTRADNIIPLFKTYADLLGGCDENLVKATEKDGDPVSTFAADNYFYYAKGVASAMAIILEAIAEDFEQTLENRGSLDTLQHAIESCHHASQLEPLVVLESDLNGIFANHRANMAAHISHARFYLDVLVNALST
ncbi:MAG: DUF2333 family protein [Thermodesulfobacteriota bacterium]